MTSEYEKQGVDFLEKHNVTMDVKFLFHGPHFEDDKESRDVYQITLIRGTKVYCFRFGQSTANSGLTVKRNPYGKTLHDQEEIPRHAKTKGPNYRANIGLPQPSERDRIMPTAYDVLTCLQKSDPGTFEDFCSEYGYDSDSRKAEKTYFAVQNEYSGLRKIFSLVELDEMSEIQ